MVKLSTLVQESNLNTTSHEHKFKIEITFKMNTAVIKAAGVLVWGKETKYPLFDYGVQFINLDEVSGIITEELKILAASKNK